MTTLVNLTHAGPPVWFSFTGSGTFADPFVFTTVNNAYLMATATLVNTGLSL